MIPRKKKRVMIIVSVAILIIAIIAIFVAIYLTTDAFKSNDVLFAKYLTQYSYILEEVKNQNTMEEIDQLLENNKYNTSIEGTITYNEDEPINKLELIIEGKTDKQAGYDYKDVKIINEEDNLARVEYINSNDDMTIRLDGIKQFVSLDTEDSEAQSLIEQVNLEQWSELLTEEEQKQLLDKYFNIIVNNTNKQAYSKKTNVTITIKESSIKANAYMVTLTKEEFNNILIRILEEVKQDETILSIIQEINEDLSETFATSVEDKIEEIKSTNIGQEQRTVTVYESNGQTVRFRIETDEYELNLDRVANRNSVWLELYNKQQTEKENSLKINANISSGENENNKTFAIHNIKEDIQDSIEIAIFRKMENATISSSIEAKAYNEENELVLNLNKVDKIVNELENIIELSDDNYMNLDDLDEEQRSNVEKVLAENVQNQLNKLQNVVSIEDIKNMLISVNILEKDAEQLVDTNKITEAEKNRFNVKFEFFQGEELSKDNVKEMINVVKDHLDDVKIMEYKEKRRESDPDEPKTYLIIVKKENKNEELADVLLEKIDAEEDREKYTIKIEYNEETGLVKNIILSINE